MAHTAETLMSNLKPSYWNKNGWTEAALKKAITDLDMEINLLRECSSPLVVEDIHSRRRRRKLLCMALDSHLLRNPPRGWNL
jgi:hypothetical protein